RRQWETSLALAERQLEIARASGMFLITFHSYVMLAIQCAQTRRATECRQAAAEVRALTADTAHAHFSYYADLAEAYLALQSGDRSTCRELLRAALARSRQDEFKFLLRLQGEVCTSLFAEALARAGDVEYVKQLIRGVNGPPPASIASDWPWPLRIYSLGRFEVLRDGRPLEFSRKAPKKTLALLKAIIALGARNVREQQLLDAFWSDEEGDVAARSLTAALHRLRSLLGDNN